MKRALQITVSLVLSALFVWLSVRNTPLDQVSDALRRADLRFVAANFAALFVIHVVRTVRWGLLLAPLAKVNFRTVNPIAAVGFLALVALPLRLGELARPILAAHHLGVRRSAALASVVVERVVDGVFMGLVLVSLLWTLSTHLSPDKLAWIQWWAAVVAVGWVVGLALLVTAYRTRAKTLPMIGRVLSRVSQGLSERVTGMLDAFFGGLAVVPSAGKLLQFVGATAAYWGTIVVGQTLLAPAFGFELSFRDAWMVVGLQVIGALIPAGPGGAGTIQFFTVVGLEFVLPPEQRPAAIAFAHASWALSTVQQIVLGLAYARKLGLASLGAMVRDLWKGSPKGTAD